MLRLTWRAAGLPPRVLSQEAFLSEFESLAERNFAGLPAGPVLVEGLDPEHRLIWSGHYKSADELRVLLRQLREERALMQAHNGSPEK